MGNLAAARRRAGSTEVPPLYSITEYRREVEAFAVAFRPVSEHSGRALSLHYPTFPFSILSLSGTVSQESVAIRQASDRRFRIALGLCFSRPRRGLSPGRRENARRTPDFGRAKTQSPKSSPKSARPRRSRRLYICRSEDRLFSIARLFPLTYRSRRSNLTTTMKLIWALVVVGIAAAAPQDHYGLDVSALDVDGFLKDPAKMKMYTDCLLDLGPCSPLGEAVKKELPQALATGCAKCTPAQKQVIRRILVTGKEQLPAEREQLIRKYDPQGQYHDKIEEFLASTD
ncbi:Ejaculatory bulb-specific protein 3 [Eumeta japonica]|uniref:Ejaculatory bulb-specific protein 3 n=1 Tax=Eumeta variegata TaxID=151549 RepID=A0A4C1YDZ4_EUMVA|nr:Ejaculatory bulb-specific protein 3 [Eumeta japonica]